VRSSCEIEKPAEHGPARWNCFDSYFFVGRESAPSSVLLAGHIGDRTYDNGWAFIPNFSYASSPGAFQLSSDGLFVF